MATYDKMILIQKVKCAFKDENAPERKKVGERDELPDWVYKTRDFVTYDDLNIFTSLLWFSDQSLRYFLPLYLIALLEHPERMRSDLPRWLVEELGQHLRDSRSQNRCKAFTDEQQEVIIEFLEHYDEFFPRSPITISNKGRRQTIDAWETKDRKFRQELIESWKMC